MAYLPQTGSNFSNLVDVTRRMDPDGSIATIAELLSQYNPILMDIPMVEGNLPTGHRSTIRADLPTATWRYMNYGVKPTKSKTVQVDDTIGMLEDYGEVDKDLAMLNGNTAEFRLSEDTPHIESMSNVIAETIFYGDVNTNPQGFHGLTPRYNSLDIAASKPDATTQSSQLKHVVDMGGTANLTSLWLVCWGEKTVHGIYPKGSQAGLLSEDLGEQTLFDDEGGRYQGYRSHYQWKKGLSVPDWRYIVRVANIDVTAIDAEATQKALYQAMIKAMHTIPQGNMGKKVFYAGSAVAAMLDIAAVEKANASLGIGEEFGQEFTTFRRIPVKECHALIEDETQVV